MPDRIYSFEDQLKVGEDGEKVLDAHAERGGCTVRPATRRQQRSGVDRIMSCGFYRECLGEESHEIAEREEETYTLEYKTDTRGHKTGNAFVETVAYSSSSEWKEGWLYSCQADFIWYYLPGNRNVYQIDPRYLRVRAVEWLEKYPVRRVQNQGWYTEGILVPLEVLETATAPLSNVNDPES